MKRKIFRLTAIIIVFLFSLSCEDEQTEADASEIATPLNPEEHTTTDPITIKLKTPEGDEIDVQAEIVDGLVIAEGDMILGPASILKADNSGFTKANALGVTYTSSPYYGTKWANAVVPYTIHTNFSASERKNIEFAIKLFNRDSPVKFVIRTYQTDYVRFEKSATENSSYVGNNPDMDRQPINIYDTRSGVVLHEMGHAIGLHHEHQRSDRDTWVSLVDPADENDRNYVITVRNASTYNTPFDYASIMMYETGLNRNDGKRIQTRNYWGLSTLDVIGIARMYNKLEIVRYADHRAGDFNNDGLSDILFTWGNGTLHVALTQLVGSEYKAVYAGEWISYWGHGNGIYQLGDFDGKNGTDVMFIEPTTDEIHVALSTTGSFRGAGGGVWIWKDENHDLFGTIRNGGQYRIGDFNGDNKDDLFFFEPANNTINVALSNGQNFYGNGSGQWIGPNGFGSFNTGQYTIGNFDGDEYDDLLFTSLYNRKYYVALSTGYSFGKSGSGVWYDADNDTDYFLMNTNNSSRTLTAVNVDRTKYSYDDKKDDLVLWSAPLGMFLFARSTGSSFSTVRALSEVVELPGNESLYRVEGGEFLFGHFNTDKRMDVITRFGSDSKWEMMPNNSFRYFFHDDVYTYISTGGFGDVSDTSVYR